MRTQMKNHYQITQMIMKSKEEPGLRLENRIHELMIQVKDGEDNVIPMARLDELLKARENFFK